MLANAYQSIRTFFAMRGARLVECPETQQSAAVVVDAMHAAWTTASSSTDIRLSRCSRWPDKAGCAQRCVRQIEAAPDACSVKHVLTKWYADKKCVVCNEGFNRVDWAHQKPTLMRPDGTIAEWYEFRPEQIPDALQTHSPVCWNCYVEETFRSQHPELFN
jgi:hypothetical protein